MPRTTKRSETTDAVEIMHRRYFEDKPEMMAMLEEELVNAELSRLVFDLRTAAKFDAGPARQARGHDAIGDQPFGRCRL